MKATSSKFAKGDLVRLIDLGKNGKVLSTRSNGTYWIRLSTALLQHGKRVYHVVARERNLAAVGVEVRRPS